MNITFNLLEDFSSFYKLINMKCVLKDPKLFPPTVVNH